MKVSKRGYLKQKLRFLVTGPSKAALILRFQSNFKSWSVAGGGKNTEEWTTNIVRESKVHKAENDYYLYGEMN